MMYQTKEQKRTVNRLLHAAGLGPLHNPERLLPELGPHVRDHEHFQSLLAATEPEDRRSMYEGLKPYLRFQAWPFDMYEAATARKAEAMQWPTRDAEGMLHPFKSPEIATEDLAVANDAVAEAFNKGMMVFTCRKCTKTEAFPGVPLHIARGETARFAKADAVKRARDAGWRYDEIFGVGSEVCPDCP